VLLLQGPVGPFFSDLHKSLIARGFSVRRVVFNAGDSLFAQRCDRVCFNGTPEEWETWLRFELAQNTPDAIVLFGSSRPAHEVARRLAAYFGIAVISLEEGYLRSGYISCEWGGNNQYSPLADWNLGKHRHMAPKDVAPHASGGSTFAVMSFWGACYYLFRDVFPKGAGESLYHRRRERVLPMALSWVIHMIRRGAAKAYEFPIRRALRSDPGYILVPLQVSTDSQLNVAARGWNIPRLIDACLKALVDVGSHQRIVFKLHPLERKASETKRLILRKAKQYGIPRDRAQVLHSGRISDLTHQASGMAVINSTSAFSALHHNVPVLVLGDAVFRHHDIVTVGEIEADVSTFFKLRHSRSREVINTFLIDLKAQSLLPGDFYASHGRKIAVDGIVEKLGQIQIASRRKNEASG